MSAVRLVERRCVMAEHENNGNNERVGVAVKPVERVTVMLFGSPVRAVRLPDGRIAAVFTDLTDALDLYRASQARRVRSDEVTADQLFLAEIDVEGVSQPMDVLTAWAIPIWLAGIQLGKIAPEKRPAILAFKREAADVLYRRFSTPHESHTSYTAALPTLPTPANIVIPAPMTQPDKPTSDANRAAWIDYHQAMVAWLEWQDDMEHWRTESDAQAAALAARQEILEARQDGLEDRMEGVEELSRLFVEVTEALGPQTLTPAHQATVKTLVGQLHEVGGFTFGAIYGDLNAAFHVGKFSDIPDTQ